MTEAEGFPWRVPTAQTAACGRGTTGTPGPSRAGCGDGITSTAALASQGAGWFVITSPGSAFRDGIEAGRRFERMALLARERGVGIHPMTQLLEEPEGRQRIAENRPTGLIPQFMLCVGYAEPYRAPVSLRRPVNWFLRP